MKFRARSAVRWALVVIATTLPAVARAQEANQIRPEVDLLKESVSEKLRAAADQLGLTEEQRDKIRAIDPGLAAKCTAQREALRTEGLKAMGDIPTPQQRKRVKNGFANDSDGP